MKTPNSDVTQTELMHMLDYNPATGVFLWKNPSKYQVSQKGKVAGRIDSGGYRQIAINKKRYAAHRLAWLYVYGKWPEALLDHKNLVKDDNRIENLRECTLINNCWNRRMRSDNTTGLKGVTPSYKGKFGSYIAVEGKNIYLGYFDTAEEAHAAYVVASKKYHGEFGRTA